MATNDTNALHSQDSTSQRSSIMVGKIAAIDNVRVENISNSIIGGAAYPKKPENSPVPVCYPHSQQPKHKSKFKGIRTFVDHTYIDHARHPDIPLMQENGSKTIENVRFPTKLYQMIDYAARNDVSGFSISNISCKSTHNTFLITFLDLC